MDDPSPLLSFGDATPEVLGPVMGSSVQKNHGHIRESSAKGHKNEEGSGAFLPCGKAERAVTI